MNADRNAGRMPIATAAALIVVVACLAPAAAQTGAAPGEPQAKRMEAAPDALDGVGITEHLDATIPLDLEFVDENGDTVRLGDYFDGERPVILNLVYYSCPMLCNLILNGQVDALKNMDEDWTAGGRFEIVTVSIDPVETPRLARLKKESYLEGYGRPEAGAGWHFLTGKEENILALADAVGFGYQYVEDRNEFAHGAAIFVITPDARISRYLYGVMFEPATLRLALLEASEGKIGSVVDRVLLYCFHYDSVEGRYAVAAMKLMRFGGFVTLAVLGTAVAVFWRREARRKRERHAS